MKKELTCIVCPVGCPIGVEIDANGTIVKIEGNACPRGALYAKEKITDPRRIVTSTVRIENLNFVLPVKTSAPVPKGEIFRVMEKINSVQVTAPLRIGDIVIKDVYPGINIVATADID